MNPANDNLGTCKNCGLPWHPPALCWAYQCLDVETIERIAANIIRYYFEEPDTATWEGEGGR